MLSFTLLVSQSTRVMPLSYTLPTIQLYKLTACDCCFKASDSYSLPF